MCQCMTVNLYKSDFPLFFFFFFFCICRDNPESSDEAHRLFMENYQKMFVPEPKKVGFPVHTEKRAM